MYLSIYLNGKESGENEQKMVVVHTWLINSARDLRYKEPHDALGAKQRDDRGFYHPYALLGRYDTDEQREQRTAGLPDAAHERERVGVHGAWNEAPAHCDSGGIESGYADADKSSGCCGRGENGDSPGRRMASNTAIHGQKINAN